jgi:flagellar biosynthesis/type III secretory pathway chaperone
MTNSPKHPEDDELIADEFDCLQERLGQIEELLVQEFRACQALHSLTREERQALSNGDVSRLAGMVEVKEALLDQLGWIEDERRQITMAISPNLQNQIAGEYERDPVGERCGIQWVPARNQNPENRLPSLSEILKVLQTPQARPVVAQLACQLDRLQEGILALALSVREMNSVNLALASAAIERADAVQAFLLNLMPPAAGYQPPGAPRRSQAGLARDIDHKT